MGYSEAGGKLFHEKNQKQKISWHCPFKFNFFWEKDCKPVVQSLPFIQRNWKAIWSAVSFLPF